ncbi:hypothetical protein [Streptosporangium minutum]|uniref:hypothetical protein n=1 Tax=Streptosporangium minutum TaxID=569862 RepID=UPI0013FD3751|nr:hypothetical protein [Streptosporangium minutum]
MADVPPEQARDLVPITRHGIGARLGECLATRDGTAARRWSPDGARPRSPIAR